MRPADYFGINPDDSEALVSLVARRPAVRGYFAGHTHRNRVRRFAPTGDVPFVVPGLAVTIIAFALAQLSWSRAFGVVDAVVRRAAAHTLGIFLAHYLIYGALRRYGLLGTVEPVLAVPVALAVTVALCLVAPRVPQLPWSLRTGRRPPARRVRASSKPPWS